MNSAILTNISKILECDSKSTTYKFALLRGVIDIILENSPYIRLDGKRAYMPQGLLIEKWLTYYYPIVESQIRIPQINGNAKLAFEDHLSSMVNNYKRRGGFSAFYNDLTRKSIPEDLRPLFLLLVMKLRSTITLMPMKYIGTSISKTHYSIFKFDNGSRISKARALDIQFLIQSFGSFSIPAEYYEALKFLGRFVNGKDSILMKWAEFSVNAAPDGLSVERVLHDVLRNPVTVRDVLESKRQYAEMLKSSGTVRCVWTDRVIAKCDVDHVIPFSVWRNNDLWNLLPSSPNVNNAKRDRIPSSILIERQKGSIVHYWSLLNEKFPQRFKKEIEVALLGGEMGADWQPQAINRLKQTCDYLIGGRGYDAWEA